MDTDTDFSARDEKPNEKTEAAMLEAEQLAQDSSAPTYSDVEEALKVLKE